MVRVILLAAAVVLVLWSCAPREGSGSGTSPAPTAVQPGLPGAADGPFPVPYVPGGAAELWGHPVSDWGWTQAAVYTDGALNDQQRAWLAGLSPAGGEGDLSLAPARDFDGDGTDEAVSYGAWTKADGTTGNFVAVTRGDPPPRTVLLMKELPGPARISVFTVKPDLTLWFGGGINAGEVAYKLAFGPAGPVVTALTGD